MLERFGIMEFYSSNQWRRLRARYRRANPLCRRCGSRAEHVDHIVEIATAPERRLDWFNLQCLCLACHNEKTAADKGGRSMRPHGGCDADGMPLDPRHPWNATQRGATGGRGGHCNPEGRPAGSGSRLSLTKNSDGFAHGTENSS